MWLHRTLLVRASRMHRKSAHMWTASQADLKEGGRTGRQAGGQQRGRAGQAYILAIICVHHKLPGLCDAPPILQHCKEGEGSGGAGCRVRHAALLGKQAGRHGRAARLLLPVESYAAAAAESPQASSI